jgi:hypothetical protein
MPNPTEPPAEAREDVIHVGDRVQLSVRGLTAFAGRRVNKNRKGTVVGETRNGRSAWVLWDGLKFRQICFKSFLNTTGSERPLSTDQQNTMPPTFTLNVTYRDGWFKIRCPECSGLYIAHHDLTVALSDVPVTLAAIRRLDAASGYVAPIPLPEEK